MAYMGVIVSGSSVAGGGMNAAATNGAEGQTGLG